jgi:hypothetical protein
MKSVSCKVVKSVPFVERRFRNDPLKNKYRRTEDTQPKNTAEGHAIRYTTYKIVVVDCEASNKRSIGRFIDYYV